MRVERLAELGVSLIRRATRGVDLLGSSGVTFMSTSSSLSGSVSSKWHLLMACVGAQRH